MSRYYVEPYIRDTEAELKYTFAEVKWGKIVAIHHHWLPLREFYKFFEPGVFMIDITGVTIDGEEPSVGDTVITDQYEENKILHIKNTYTIEEKKQCIIERLKAIRDHKEQDEIMYNNISFDADEISQQRMDKARKFLEDNNVASITWTTAENTRVDIGVQDFKNINTLIALRSNDLHVRYNQLKAYINSLSEDYNDLLDLIDWDWDIEQYLDERLAQLRAEQEPSSVEEQVQEEPESSNENQESLNEEPESSNNEEQLPGPFDPGPSDEE